MKQRFTPEEQAEMDTRDSRCKLKAGIIKACGGLLADCAEPWVLEAVAQAEQYIGQDYAMNDAAQKNRQMLIEMVKLNLINRKEYDREKLNRQMGMCIGEKTMRREKKQFCYAMAKGLRLI